MWVSVIVAFVTIAYGCASAQQGSGTKSTPLSGPQTVSFCDLADAPIEPAKEIRVRAVYRVGFEWSELYSLKCQSAPRVWVDFSDGWKSQTSEAVRKELDEGGGTFGVILRGKVIAGSSFGHLGAYQMQFEVTSVEGGKRLDRESYHPKALTPEMRSRVEEFEAKQ